MLEKRTKIIATISDRRCEPEFIRSLYEAGMNVVRLNTAHQSLEDSLRVVRNVRAVSEEIAILVDTKGPEVRTVVEGESITVASGDMVYLGLAAGAQGLPVFRTSYGPLGEELPIGGSVLIDDGALKLVAEEKRAGGLVCRVCNAGVLANKKSVNLPGVHINLPSLTEKDREYVKFAVEHDLDFIAHSFVRNRDDVMAIQSILDTYQSRVKIIAKIENREGVENLQDILDCAYGVMVARGDLGVEIPLDEVPVIQKRMIRACRERAKPVITATQMLHTMIENPRPTRAEVSDIATAVFDGTDAMMLSGETAYGQYPLEAVQTMARVAMTVEREKPEEFDLMLPAYPSGPATVLHLPQNIPVGSSAEKGGDGISVYLAQLAVQAAPAMGAKTILCDTKMGYSVRLLSSFRGKTPVIAYTHDLRVRRELALSFGICPYFISNTASTDDMVRIELSQLVVQKLLGMDDLVLILASTPERRGGANLLEFNTPRECLQS